MPFRCAYCGLAFCEEHRLPESHNCMKLPGRDWNDFKEIQDARRPGEKAEGGEGSLPRGTDTKQRGADYGRIVLVIFVVVSLAFGGYWGKIQYEAGMVEGYESGSEDGYVSGYDEGHSDGNEAGYESGYYSGHDTGFDEGYDDGESFGYASGYGQGHEEGYERGYSNGSDAGYSAGYSEGYDEGNTDGYYEGRSDGYSEGYSDGNETGWDEGYSLGLGDGAVHGWNIRDPSYSEMRSFLILDRTDKKTYDEDTFNCKDFTANVIQNAFEEGYQCYFVSIEFGDTGHALVGFNTTDRGFVYIEPQSDERMYPEIGENYWPRSKYIVDWDDTITDIDIIP